MNPSADTCRGALIDRWRCVIFDVDGTLLNNKHRSHLVSNEIKEPRDWKTYRSLAHLDTPYDVIVTLARTLRQHYAIIIATGRIEAEREVTTATFRKHGIYHDGMWMRGNKDNRPDPEVKKDMLAEIRAVGFVPQFVVDDRNSVVAMWRSEGLVCLQCQDGDF